MSQELEEAKLFSEQIDRMLAGEEIKIDGEMSDDLRRALDFAREMKALRAEPSPQYQALLKARLLGKIKAGAAAPVKAKQSWWEILIRRPVWQTVTAVVVIAIVSGVIWAAGFFRTAENPVITSKSNVAAPTSTVTTTAAPATAAPPPMATTPPSLGAAGVAPPSIEANAALLLQVGGTTDKSVYTNSSSDPVAITITLQNVSGQPLQIQPYPPALSLMQSAAMPPVFTFTAGDQVKTLAANETVSYTWSWDQKDAGNNLVSPGEYYIELGNLDLNGRTVPLPLSSPVQFEIKPAN